MAALVEVDYFTYGAQCMPILQYLIDNSIPHMVYTDRTMPADSEGIPIQALYKIQGFYPIALVNFDKDFETMDQITLVQTLREESKKFKY